jgi:hypothetical protein
MIMKRCSRCVHWSNEHWVEEKYGMGFGWCNVRTESTFCDKHNCMFFIEQVGD